MDERHVDEDDATSVVTHSREERATLERSGSGFVIPASVSFEDISITSPGRDNEFEVGGISAEPNAALDFDDVTIIDEKKPWYCVPLKAWPYISTFFITVAGVLGTGILGVPVKLDKSGFTPFFVTYSVTFVMQTLVILFVVEIMQRVHWMSGTGIFSDLPVLQESRRSQLKFSSEARFQQDASSDDVEMDVIAADGTSPSPDEVKREDEEQSDDDDYDPLAETPRELDTHDRSLTGRVDDEITENASKSKLEKGPDLHSMGLFFLSKYLAPIYMFAIVMHFVTILISYGLAGPQAYHQLLDVLWPAAGRWIPYQVLILPFIGILTLLIVFGMNVVRIIISLLTTVKGSLLIVVVVVTLFVGVQVNLEIDNDWRYTLEPFLIGTLALGGAISVLPVAFSKIDYTPWGMWFFSFSSIAGLFGVFVLNLLWAYSILLVVPQTGEEPSLEQAAEDGEIATIPLVDVIDQDHEEYFWIAVVIEIFIISSITVSFMTMGSGFRHMMDGFIRHWHLTQQERAQPETGANPYLLRVDALLRTVGRKQLALYTLGFGLIYVVAQLNPSAFLVIIEYASSLAINVTSGIFTVLMLGKARDMSPLDEIPWRLPWWIYHTRWAVFVYFGFAVVYDVVIVSYKATQWFLDKID